MKAIIDVSNWLTINYIILCIKAYYSWDELIFVFLVMNKDSRQHSYITIILISYNCNNEYNFIRLNFLPRARWFPYAMLT